VLTCLRDMEYWTYGNCFFMLKSMLLVGGYKCRLILRCQGVEMDAIIPPWEQWVHTPQFLSDTHTAMKHHLLYTLYIFGRTQGRELRGISRKKMSLEKLKPYFLAVIFSSRLFIKINLNFVQRSSVLLSSLIYTNYKVNSLWLDWMYCFILW
jgi:hypothetical protein